MYNVNRLLIKKQNNHQKRQEYAIQPNCSFADYLLHT